VKNPEGGPPRKRFFAEKESCGWKASWVFVMERYSSLHLQAGWFFTFYFWICGCFIFGGVCNLGFELTFAKAFFTFKTNTPQ